MDDRRKLIYKTPPEAEQRPINWPMVLRRVARWSLAFAALYFVYWLLLRTGSSLVPFIIGLLLAYLLQPVVNWLNQRMPRWAAILVVYLVGLGIFMLGSLYIFPPAADQINQLIRAVPGQAEQLQETVNRLVDEFQRTASPEVREQVNEQIRNVQGTLQENATTYAQQAGEFLVGSILTIFDTLTFLIGFLVIPFFLFYTLNDTPRIPAAINSVLHPNIRDDFWNIWKILDRVFGQYLRGQLTLGIIVGTLIFIGLSVLSLLGYDISYKVLLAIVAGVGELIPFIGPILSAIPAILVALGDGWSTVIAVIILYVIIQQIENQVLVPRVVGNTLKLHPAVLLVLFVAAAAVGGLLLVILAPPLAAIARDVFIYAHRRLREPPLPPELAIRGLLPKEEIVEAQQAAAELQPPTEPPLEDRQLPAVEEQPAEEERHSAAS